MIKKRMSSDERKKQILDIALDIFAQKGFSGARTREIAELAGISETLIYRHFKTKEDLYAAALHHLFGSHPMHSDMNGPLECTDDEEVFFQLALHMLKHTAKDPRIIRLHLFQLLDGQTGSNIEGRSEDRKTLAMLAEYIANRSREGVFVQQDPECMARLFHYMVYMAVTDAQMNLWGQRFETSPEKMARTLSQTFLNGLRQR